MTNPDAHTKKFHAAANEFVTKNPSAKEALAVVPAHYQEEAIMLMKIGFAAGWMRGVETFAEEILPTRN